MSMNSKWYGFDVDGYDEAELFEQRKYLSLQA